MSKVLRKTTLINRFIVVLLLVFFTDAYSLLANDSMLSVASKDSLNKPERMKGHAEVPNSSNNGFDPSVAQRAIRGFGRGAPEGRVIVRLRPGQNQKAITNQLKSVTSDLVTLRRFPLAEKSLGRTTGPRWIMVVESKNRTTTELIDVIKSNPAVEIVEPDHFVYALATTPNDARYNELWGLHNSGQFNGSTSDADIDAPEAWDRITGNGSAIIGVIDTGVDYDHPDLAANMWRNIKEQIGSVGVDDDGNGYVDDLYGIDTLNHDSDPMDDGSHGSHTAGTLGATGNNEKGVSGVNWNVKIAACKFIGSDGVGFDSGAIECINYFTWLKQHGENIVATNNSWGGNSFSQTMKNAIDAGGAANILFVAAAGNQGQNNDITPSYPASFSSASVISVAATTFSDNIANFSNYGANSVDLGAPGQSILSTVVDTNLSNGTYAYYSGTSMAAPHVAGAVALAAMAFPGESATARKARILSSVDVVSSLSGKVVTNGRLNLSKVVVGGTDNLLRWPDFNADARYDLVWRNYASGANAAWYMNGTSVAGGPGIFSVTDLNWRIVGTPDMNYDGKPDILWRHYASGSVVVWYMSGVSVFGSASIGTESDVNWRIVGTPDMNGDGKPDILWRHYANGSIVVWYMNGAGIVAGVGISTITDLNWRIVGTPDMNNDGKSDILWRHYSAGVNYVWYMNGASLVNGEAVPTTSDVTWRIVATPDVNLDGKPDIVWRNSSSGANYVWYLNGITYIGGASLPTVSDTSWVIENNGDY